jgi:hypothetical protein
MQYRQADDSGWWRVEMDELKKFLNIEREHIYWSNNHFRIKVFNPAIKEITRFQRVLALCSRLASFE